MTPQSLSAMTALDKHMQFLLVAPVQAGFDITVLRDIYQMFIGKLIFLPVSPDSLSTWACPFAMDNT